MSAWTGKPCVGCGGKKGPKYVDLKYCGRCTHKVRKVNSDVAHRRRVATRYNIGIDDYDRLLEIQSGRCAICQWATGKSRRLSVDHDHKTERVRGLLCRPCNDLLGHARDDVEFFVRAIAYLTSPPAGGLPGTPTPTRSALHGDSGAES